MIREWNPHHRGLQEWRPAPEPPPATILLFRGENNGVEVGCIVLESTYKHRGLICVMSESAVFVELDFLIH